MRIATAAHVRALSTASGEDLLSRNLSAQARFQGVRSIHASEMLRFANKLVSWKNER